MKEKYSSYRKNKMMKMTLISVATAILAVGSFFGGGYLRKAQWESEVKKSFGYAFIGENREIEYGTEMKIIDLRKELLDVNLTVESIKISINDEIQKSDNVYKFLKVDENKIKCTLTDVIYGEQVIVARTYIYKVIDTAKPIFEGICDKEIFQGEDIDLKAGIIAKDPVDGELEVNTEGEFNKDVPGEYTITAKATDKNNNESSQNFKVVVKKKEEATTSAKQAKSEKTNKSTSQESSSGSTSSSSASSSSSSKTTSSSSSKSSSTTQAPADTFNYRGLSSNATNTFNLVNAKRVEAGVNALTWDSSLAKVAEARAMDLSKTGTFSHTTPNLGTPAQSAQKYGISYMSLAENLAGNSSDSAAVVAWMNSPGHKTNMLNAKYKKTGIGVVTSPKYGKIYCQIFTN